MQGTHVFSRRQVFLVKAWYDAVPQACVPGAKGGGGGEAARVVEGKDILVGAKVRMHARNAARGGIGTRKL